LVIITYTSFFKYISPKEKKELKTQRDKLFKDVEKLLKKENFLEVIDAFDQIAEISEKLGELGVADEFKDRANNLRRKLGQEVKSDISVSQEEINGFIKKLLIGPFRDIQAAEILTVSPSPVASGGTRSLIEEGEEILARLKKFKGEEGVTSPGLPIAATPPPMTPPKATPTGPPIAATPPPMAPPNTTPAGPPIAATPPPMTPPKATPAGPPITATPPPMTPPKATPTGPPIASNLPPVPSAPPTTSPPNFPPNTNSLETTPVAFPVPHVPPENIQEFQLLDEIEEPQVQGIDTFIESEPEVPVIQETKKKSSKKNEKSEWMARIERELPYLPDKKKKGILKELLKRPEGKLRETWLKVYIHKNKQYAAKQ